VDRPSLWTRADMTSGLFSGADQRHASIRAMRRRTQRNKPLLARGHIRGLRCRHAVLLRVLLRGGGSSWRRASRLIYALQRGAGSCWRRQQTTCVMPTKATSMDSCSFFGQLLGQRLCSCASLSAICVAGGTSLTARGSRAASPTYRMASAPTGQIMRCPV
jgi:hypothetical protein